MEERFTEEPTGPPEHDAPAFNAPLAVLLTITTFVLVHWARTHMLTPQQDNELLATFAVIPALYDAWWRGVPLAQLPGGGWGLLLAPFAHFFLHANWTHVAMNSLWLLVFATPVARRLGGVRYLALALLSAAAGAFTFLALHWGEDVLLVGASGGVSGLMGAAVRFIYADGVPLAVGIRRDVRRVRPLSFMQALVLPGPRLFILLWVALNTIISLIGFGAGQGMDNIAGEAHIGGFFAGMALLGLLDRRARS